LKIYISKTNESNEYLLDSFFYFYFILFYFILFYFIF